MAQKKTFAAFHVVVSGADLKRALEEREQAESRRDEDIATVKEFLADEHAASPVEVAEYVDASRQAVEAFERLIAWMHRT